MLDNHSKEDAGSSAMVKLHFHFFLSRRNLTLESVHFLFLPDRAKLLQFKSYLKKSLLWSSLGAL
jgi:hypothetical protein